ncbi:hypothetical protein [Sutterella sp.]|uniref:hypothetical protein n=1 Tax=Sutterella sp. TaxID=1981025 RepID=UPI0026E06179|nr:hypothetical protein [Sutterella sp.]MDO5531979.1 hypothetical protein [Sutterella sp.]
MSQIEASKFAEIYNEKTPDPLWDVDGGNPWSPVWVCGLEFGGGEMGIERFRSSADRKSDITGMTSFSADRDIYTVRAAALVACLTDVKFAEELGTRGNKRAFALEWFQKHRVLATGGHGFRMNAGIFSLATHSGSWTPELSEFCGGAGQAEYEAYAAKIHAEHVKARLRAFRPRLVLCFGYAGWERFRQIFLTEAEAERSTACPVVGPTEAAVENPGERRRLRYEIWNHEETETAVVLTGFPGRRGNLNWNCIAPLSKLLRAEPSLKWLGNLEPVPEFGFRDDGNDEDLKRCLPDLSDRFGYEDFLASQALGEWLGREEVDDAVKAGFERMIHTVRPVCPWDAGEFLLAEDQRGARLWLALSELLAVTPPERRSRGAIEALARIVKEAGERSVPRKA